MILYLFGLLLSSFCCLDGRADDSFSRAFLESRNSDPSSLVENVSIIYGDYTELEIDVTVSAPDPLVLSRFYSSRDNVKLATLGGWRFNPHCFLLIQKDPKRKSYTTAEGEFEHTYVYVGNPDGKILTYTGW